MAKFTKKITNLLNQQVPECVLSDHPTLLEFVNSYHKIMESAEITLANIELTDGIQLETETAQTNSLVLDASKLDTDRTQLDEGDKILLEDSGFGKFQRGEIVTGQTSNATATVLSEDLVNNRLFISAQDKFIQDEVIIGATSTAQAATISNYKPNPVNNIQDLLNFRDPDKAISNFLTKNRNEFLNTLPSRKSRFKFPEEQQPVKSFMLVPWIKDKLNLLKSKETKYISDDLKLLTNLTKYLAKVNTIARFDKDSHRAVMDVIREAENGNTNAVQTLAMKMNSFKIVDWVLDSGKINYKLELIKSEVNTYSGQTGIKAVDAMS